MTGKETEKEIINLSELFLSEDENERNSFDDPDYIIYDEFEEAEVIIIPIEEEVIPEKKGFTFNLPQMDVESFITAFISFLIMLGESTSETIGSVFGGIFAVIKIPVVFLWQKVILKIVNSVKTRAHHSAKRMNLHEYRKFREDARKAMKNVRNEETLKERHALFTKNIVLSFSKHRRVWVGAVNIVFPIICLALLAATAGHYSNMTYALKVNYNGRDIGFIASEDVFNAAKDSAIEKLATGSSDGVKLSTPTYSVAMLTPDKLSDSKAMSEKIIENTDGNFVNACGIYIDGEFVCAVKNEVDAVNVFDKILEPYEKKAGKDASVAFVQEIKYVQGFYQDNEDVIWGSDKLQEEMNSSKNRAVYYTVKDGDSPLSIAADNKLSYSQLIKLNPSLAQGNIHVGDKILLSAQINNIRVKVMKTETRTVTLPYESETKESNLYYKGTSKTIQNGQKGEQKITELVTYIDGVKTYATTVSTVTTKYPVKEIIYKGTKEVIQYRPSTPSRPGSSSYTGGYSNYLPGNSSAPNTSFGSPMASSYYISSSFGGRTVYGRYNFHRGVDLCHSGGSAGIPVLSVANGTVISVIPNHSSWGATVLIQHANGIQTRYAHMQYGSISVRTGQSVSKGQQIGRVGSTGNSTGNHLHFEVTKNGALVNPAPYLH